MINVFNPLYNGDFSNAALLKRHPKDIKKMVISISSYSISGHDRDLVMFGLQGYIKSYLIDGFNKGFFRRNINDVTSEYKRLMDGALGANIIDYNKIRNLHKLGYLPIEIKAIPEGTRVPIKVPMIEISNTHPDFVWVLDLIEPSLVNTLSDVMSCANRTFAYRQIVNYYYDKTVENQGVNKKDRSKAAIVYSTLKQQSAESAIKSGAASLLSFSYTDSIGAIKYIDDYYSADNKEITCGEGSVSFEHAMINATNDDVSSYFKNLLLTVCPSNSFTIVADKEECWKYIEKLLPNCRVEIANHQGTLRIRCDVGDPVNNLCGEKNFTRYANETEMYNFLNEKITKINNGKHNSVFEFETYYGKTIYVKNVAEDEYHEISIYYDCQAKEYVYAVQRYIPSIKDIGILDALYNILGGVVNKKGYIELPNDIKVIVSNGITANKANKIYTAMTGKGYAASNVLLGLNQYMFNNDGGYLSARDDVGIQSATTYYETDNKHVMAYNNSPINGSYYNGCSIVYRNNKNKIEFLGGFELEDTYVKRNLMNIVFRNGKMIIDYSFDDIKNTLHKE